MDSSNRNNQAGAVDFRIGDWLVEPSLNRLTLDDTIVQLEPKLMDVLVFLSEHAGSVVSKIEITDAVWPEVFITESVITRSIAGLRRAFGDDVRQPRFIETISKRGYRLIAEVSASPGTKQTTSIPPPEPHRTTGPSIPFVVGQWVRGENFYGRSALIEEVLRGNRNWIWLLGTRRIGKTSVLKQLEFIASTTPDLGFVPVFWDLQGADTPEDLHLDFTEALLDAEERLSDAGVRLDDVRADDCFESLGRLRRQLLSRKLRLLLLCDEVEELLNLNQKDPSLLRKLRRALQSREGIRSVLAASGRLWELATPGEDTSPFLDGFTPPLYIGPMSDDEAEAVIRQNQLAENARPTFSDDRIETIRRVCGNHPYVIQLLCRRYLDHGELEPAIEGLAADRAVGFFFAVDFELLGATDRELLRFLAEKPDAKLAAIQKRLGESDQVIAESAATLTNLGLIRADGENRYAIASAFFQRWLSRQ